jgi:co-chaperonin GroES (HSP10)
MIRVLGDRVLVALPPRDDETTTASGIVLVKDPDRFYTPTRGIVMQLGEKETRVELDDVRAELNEQRRQFEQMAQTYAGPSLREVFDDIDRALMTLQPAPFDVNVGDVVIFSASAGDQITQDGIDYVLLREDEILGVVDANSEAA